MENPTHHNQSFRVRLWPPRRFLRGLSAMMEVSRSAVLLIRSGEVELRIGDFNCTALASLILEASTVVPFSSSFTGFYAFHIDMFDLMNRLQAYFAELENKSLSIYKIQNCPDLCFVVGYKREPIRLDGQHEVLPDFPDLRVMELLPVKVKLRSECLREVINSFAPKNKTVFVHIFDDHVSWSIMTANLVYTEKDGKCWVEGVAVGRERYLCLEWVNSAKPLVQASWLAEEVVIRLLADPERSRWVAFCFPIDGKNHFTFLVQGLQIHMVMLAAIA